MVKEYRKYKFILCKTSLMLALVFALLLPSNTWALSGAPDKTNASAVELASSRNALPKRTFSATIPAQTAGTTVNDEIDSIAGDLRIYVDSSASGANDGSTWLNAYTSLQAALLRSNLNPGTRFEVWVAAGTYKPTTGTDRTISFRIERNNVQLYGGFAGTETERSQRNWADNPTILSGDIGTVGDNGDNSYHVVWVDGVTYENITASSVIDGFTITAGRAYGDYPHYLGGGLYCAGNGSGKECSPALSNVTFSGNQASHYGGGMYNDGYNGGVSSPTLNNVTFSGNQTSGGWRRDVQQWLLWRRSSPALSNVTFSGNIAAYNGGGMLQRWLLWHQQPGADQCYLQRQSGKWRIRRRDVQLWLLCQHRPGAEQRHLQR